MLIDTSERDMSQERKLKVRPVPLSNKGGPFRAYVSVQVLELFGGKSETACWVLGKNPVPVTLWREHPPAKGGNKDTLSNHVIQLSETVRQIGRLNLEDSVVLLREESAWVPNAGTVVMEESSIGAKPYLEGHVASEQERDQRLRQETDDRITRKALQEPAFHAIVRNEVVVCGQQIEVFAQGASSKSTLTIRQIDGSQAGGLHWVTEDTQVEVVRRQRYDMKISRDRIGGLGDMMDRLDDILADFGQHRPSRVDPIRHLSQFILLTGPSGGGKTTLIKALARLSWPKIFRLSTDSRSPTKIRNVMNDARHFGRALILIDDVEKIAKPEAGQLNHFGTDLLRSMSEIRKDTSVRVLLVAATRDPQDIHSRLLEADSFDYVFRAGLPKIGARQDMLKMRLARSGTPDEAISQIARRTHAFSGRDIYKLSERLAAIKDKAASSRLSTASSFEKLSESKDHTAKDWLVYAEQALKQVQPTTMQGLHIEIPETRFADIGGQHELKARLEQQLREPIVHPELYAQWGLKPLKGLLMYGPAGCSKTLMARALATEFRFNFLLVNASELISSYVGESEKRLRELFRQARDAAPCILFFDEFETIGAARGGRDTHAGLNIVQTMLTEMDGVKPLENVFVLAATNRPDILDPALLRPGRLHPHVLFGLPDRAARREIIKIRLDKIPEESIGDDVAGKLDEFAERTEGFTGAQMTELTEGALMAAVRSTLTNRVVTAEHFEKVMRTMSVTVTQEEMERYQQWVA